MIISKSIFLVNKQAKILLKLMHRVQLSLDVSATVQKFLIICLAQINRDEPKHLES